jgi:hypothetical protein
MFFKRIIIKLLKKHLLPALDCVTNFFIHVFQENNIKTLQDCT